MKPVEEAEVPVKEKGNASDRETQVTQGNCSS